MATVKVTPEMVAHEISQTDWRAVDTKTDAQIEAAVAVDPDAAPILTAEVVAAARVMAIRQATGLSQAAFAARYHVPVGTLRDWEQQRRTPDAAALAYLRVIEREPEAVARALAE